MDLVEYMVFVFVAVVHDNPGAAYFEVLEHVV
jgi:hypothetical protein